VFVCESHLSVNLATLRIQLLPGHQSSPSAQAFTYLAFVPSAHSKKTVCSCRKSVRSTSSMPKLTPIYAI
jgi:hypothetical protein